jgi:lysophospholipase L1-like esterase
MRPARTVGIVMSVIAVAGLVTSCNPAHPPAAVARCNVGIVGDSLTVGIQQGNRAVNQFAARGCAVSFIDARVGRPTSEGAAIIQARAAYGQLPNILVVALGTNDPGYGPSFARRIDYVMTAAAGRPVVWINIDNPVSESMLNAELLKAQARHPNLWVMDWNFYADHHPEIRGTDQIHLKAAGYDSRARQLARMVTGR